MIYYDINYRRNHVRQLPDLLDNIKENCRLSSVVRGSIEDFEIVFGVSDPLEVYDKYMKGLCPVLICTCGAGPIHLFTGNDHFVYPVEAVETVSTIGAGDNFNAGFLYSLLAQGIGKEDLTDISEQMWDKIVSTAGKFSENVCKSIHNYVDKDFDIL